MTEVKSGDTVRIRYVGALTDGTRFDSSEGRDPLKFVVGSGQVISGLDKALLGMIVGDKKTINVPAAEAYGPVNADARRSLSRDQIPENIALELGTQLQVQTSQGQELMVTVVDLTQENVVLDANHPLAGKDLVFAIELVSIG